MRLLGLDFGSKTIGVAVSDPSGHVATGVTTLHREAAVALRPSLRALKEIIREYGITELVLGYPKNMDGSLSVRCAETDAFKDKLERYFKRLPVTLWDERLSTQAVGRAFEGSAEKYAAHVDEMAAVYILQGYLDYRNNAMRQKNIMMQFQNRNCHAAKKYYDAIPKSELLGGTNGK